MDNKIFKEEAKCVHIPVKHSGTGQNLKIGKKGTEVRTVNIQVNSPSNHTKKFELKYCKLRPFGDKFM